MGACPHLAELQSLRWQDVNVQRGNVAVASGYTKNEDAKTNPMSQQLMQALRDWKIASGSNGEALVFGEYCYRKWFEKARDTAKLGKDVVFHGLRHTCISRLTMAGVDLATVQQSAGHRAIQMTPRCRHLAPEHKRRAVGLLDRILGNEVPPKSPTVVVLPVVQVAARSAA